MAAAQAAGARRYVAQNVSFLYAPEGPLVVNERARLATDAPEPFGSTVQLHVEMERRIVENASFAGLVLRFGFWYGPCTSFAVDGYTAREVRRRRYPVVGKAAGMFSFIHVDDVVAATIASPDRGAPGVYKIADDDPAPMREWLPNGSLTSVILTKMSVPRSFKSHEPTLSSRSPGLGWYGAEVSTSGAASGCVGR